LSWRRKLSMDNDGQDCLWCERVPGHRTSYRKARRIADWFSSEDVIVKRLDFIYYAAPTAVIVGSIKSGYVLGSAAVQCDDGFGHIGADPDRAQVTCDASAILHSSHQSCDWPDDSLQSYGGLTENTGRENDGPSKSRGVKMQDIKLQDTKTEASSS